MNDARASKIAIGISSCLLGEEVRFDGGHKRDAYINGTLNQCFEFVPVCPEVAIGLGTPRQPIRLVSTAAGVRAIGVKDNALDVTDRLHEYGLEMGAKLHELCGYILKRASPSCGMERVKVYTEKGIPLKAGTGIYTSALAQALPLLPMEEEGRLGDPVLRENFIERVFIYARWQDEMADGVTARKLVEFQTCHKLQIMAHSQASYRRLGRLAADAGKLPIDELGHAYLVELMSCLKQKCTRHSHTNVLQHLMGYLKNKIDTEDKQELLEVIEAYRCSLIPLIVPTTLLLHHFRRHPHPYVAKQYYLRPHPTELMLRNQI